MVYVFLKKIAQEHHFRIYNCNALFDGAVGKTNMQYSPQ